MRVETAASPARPLVQAPPARPARQAARPREALEGYLFLLPAVLVIGAFHVFPAAYAFYVSLFRWEIVQVGFLGLRNYIRLLHDPDFGRSLLLTLVYVGTTVPAEMAIGLGLALLLFQGLRARGLFRLLYFMPYITSQVAVALVWGWIFNQNYGLANGVLHALHIPNQKWLFDSSGLWAILAGIFGAHASDAVPPSLALAAVILVTVWFFVGFHTVVYLSGLSAIPQDLTEAARIDGASRVSLFQHITFPLLTPTTYFLLVFATIGAMTSFNIIFVLTGGGQTFGCGGNPLGTTKVAALFVFDRFWCQTKLGYASAAAFLLSLAVLGITLLNARAVGRRVQYVD